MKCRFGIEDLNLEIEVIFFIGFKELIYNFFLVFVNLGDYVIILDFGYLVYWILIIFILG